MYFYHYLSFFIIIPFAVLCYMPTRKYLSVPSYITGAFVLGIYALLCLFINPLIRLVGGHVGFLMPVVLLLLFIPYARNVQLGIERAVLIFVWAAGMISFSSGFTKIYVAIKAMDGIDVLYTMDTQLIRIIISIVILFGIYLFASRWKDDFIISEAVPSLMWIVWLPIPILCLAMQIGLLSYFELFGKNRVGFGLFILFIFGLFFIYIFLTEIFYTISESYIAAAKLRDEQRLMDVQKVEYKRLHDEMESQSKARHDFRHSVNTLRVLVENEDMEGLKAFIKHYDDIDLSRTIMNYCSNPTINAVLNHYCYLAKEEMIDVVIQVDIPDELAIKDPEICGLLGNIMENAIEACKKIPEDKRKLSLSMVLKNEINLYIVSTNSFDGHVLKDNDEFMSTKHEGAGIGTRSISETANKYGGVANFHYSENEFFVDVLMQLM